MLDEYVWGSVCELLQDPARLADEWSRRLDGSGGATELRADRDEAARLLTAHERSRQRLLDAYEAGALDLSELKRRSELLKKRIDAARAEMEREARRLDEIVHLRSIITRLGDFGAAVTHKGNMLNWAD